MATVDDETLRTTLNLAHKYAAKRAHTDERREEAIDAATDGIMRALENYDAGRGPFLAYAMSIVRLEVFNRLRRHGNKAARRPLMTQLSEEFQAGEDAQPAGEVPMSAELKDLPEDLRDAVRFYHIDGFDLRDCGLLMGCSAETVRQRLHRAAELLAPDAAEKPDRQPGERRMRQG